MIEIVYRNEFNDNILDQLIYEYRLMFPYKRSMTLIPVYQRLRGDDLPRSDRKELIDLFFNALKKEKEIDKEDIEKIIYGRIPKGAFT